MAWTETMNCWQASQPAPPHLPAGASSCTMECLLQLNSQLSHIHLHLCASLCLAGPWRLEIAIRAQLAAGRVLSVTKIHRQAAWQ